MKQISLFAIALLFAFGALSAQPEDLKITSPKADAQFRVGATTILKWDTLDSKGNRNWDNTFEFLWSESPDGPWNLLAVAKNKKEFKDDDGKGVGKAAGQVATIFPRKEVFYLKMQLKSNSAINTMVGPLKVYTPPPSTPDSTIEGTITNTVTLSATKIYGLKKVVYVANGGVLRIDPGTIIYGDPENTSAICVNRGGKIYANGTAQKPIVMTSGFTPGNRDRGDWGGLLIMGNAETNLVEAAIEGGIADNSDTKTNAWYGKWNGVNNNEDSSGVVRYVRIEFAGIAESPDNELNSLTLGAVGSRTVIENVMVSYAGDDAFEWFGGTVNAKNLIAYKTIDDDMDTDNGFSGKVQHVFIYRDASVADQSSSEAFESDNDSKASENQPFTRPVFSNVTAIGGVYDTSWTAGTGTDKYNSKFLTGAQIRRNSRLSLFNSVIAGWPGGLELTNQNTVRAAAADSIMVRYNNFYGIKNNKFFYFGSGTTAQGTVTADWLKTAAYGNNFSNGMGNVGTVAHFANTLPFVVASFNPLPAENADYLTMAKFDVGALQDGFFDKVSHRGAFGTTRWDLPWAEYDPNNKVYSPSTDVEENNGFRFDISATPNPSSEASRIRYSLPENDIVTIGFYNSMGQLVSTFIAKQQQEMGIHEFMVNTSNLVSGTYFIQVVTVKSGVATHQITVIK